MSEPESVNGKPILQRKEMTAALMADAQEREKRCYDRINAILQEEDCVILPESFIKDGLIQARVRIIAKT